MFPEYKACPRCHRWGYVGSHRCPQEWDWRTDDYDADDWQSGGVFADYPEDAARTIGERGDIDGDYALAGGNKMKVWVRKIGSEEVTVWIVTAEMQPVYSAYEADDED